MPFMSPSLSNLIAGFGASSPEPSEPERGSGCRFAQAESAAYRSWVGEWGGSDATSSVLEAGSVDGVVVGEGMMVREIVESGSWSSNVWAEVRSWRKRLGGWDWIAWREMVG